jgi:hypothetical protein
MMHLAEIVHVINCRPIESAAADNQSATDDIE